MPVRSQYAELKRLVECEGLLKPQNSYFVAKIIVNASLFGLGIFGLRLASLGPWWLADAAFLSFVFVQIALLGHDVAHLQFVRAGRVNTALGLILGNLLVGVSRDPNVNILLLACTPEQARTRPR